jgi:hypothetical protein
MPSKAAACSEAAGVMRAYVRDERWIADSPAQARPVSGDLLRTRAVAAELSYIPLPEALAILELMEAQEKRRFEPAAVLVGRGGWRLRCRV